MIFTRRNFLVGLIAAPAIVRVASLMPIRVLPLPDQWLHIIGRDALGVPVDEYVLLSRLDPFDDWLGHLARDGLTVSQFSHSGIDLATGNISVTLNDGSFEAIGFPDMGLTRGRVVRS